MKDEFGQSEEGEGNADPRVAILPRILKAIKGEASFFREYARTRPRFKLHIAVDAILSVALVFCSYHFIYNSQNHDRTEKLRMAGAIALSEGELVNLVKRENLIAYWAGPKSVDKYTLIATSPGEVTVSYVLKNAEINATTQSELVIQTHVHFTAHEEHTYAEDIVGGHDFLINPGVVGAAVHYNPATPTRVLIAFQNPYAVVTIINPVPDASLKLAMAPGAIRQIS